MLKVEIKKCLKEKKLKLTPQRELILDIILDAKRCLSVKEVYQKVKERYERVSIDTVYRNLYILRDLGVLREVNIGNNTMYEVKKDSHIHFMRCLTCGNVYELDLCPLDFLGNLKDFEIIEHKIEISGYCRNCKEGKECITQKDLG